MTARIADQEYVAEYPIKRLKPHPQNPNQGDVGVIASLIERQGFRGTIEVQKSTGYVTAGNHRMKACISLGMTHVPVMIVDMDDREALERVIGDNRARDLAMWDDGGLAETLQLLANDGTGLAGTGFDGDDLDTLVADLQNTFDGDHQAGTEDVRFTAQKRLTACPACGYDLTTNVDKSTRGD